MVPMAACPMRMPLPTASQAPMPGFLRITSLTPLVMSTARSIMAPAAPMKILAMKILVRSRFWYPAYSSVSLSLITAPWIFSRWVNNMPSPQAVTVPSMLPSTATRLRRS